MESPRSTRATGILAGLVRVHPELEKNRTVAVPDRGLVAQRQSDRGATERESQKGRDRPIGDVETRAVRRRSTSA